MDFVKKIIGLCCLLPGLAWCVPSAATSHDALKKMLAALELSEHHLQHQTPHTHEGRLKKERALHLLHEREDWAKHQLLMSTHAHAAATVSAKKAPAAHTAVIGLDTESLGDKNLAEKEAPKTVAKHTRHFLSRLASHLRPKKKAPDVSEKASEEGAPVLDDEKEADSEEDLFADESEDEDNFDDDVSFGDDESEADSESLANEEKATAQVNPIHLYLSAGVGVGGMRVPGIDTQHFNFNAPSDAFNEDIKHITFEGMGGLNYAVSKHFRLGAELGFQYYPEANYTYTYHYQRLSPTASEQVTLKYTGYSALLMGTAMVPIEHQWQLVAKAGVAYAHQKAQLTYKRTDTQTLAPTTTIRQFRPALSLGVQWMLKPNIALTLMGNWIQGADPEALLPDNQLEQINSLNKVIPTRSVMIGAKYIFGAKPEERSEDNFNIEEE